MEQSDRTISVRGIIKMHDVMFDFVDGAAERAGVRTGDRIIKVS